MMRLLIGVLLLFAVAQHQLTDALSLRIRQARLLLAMSKTYDPIPVPSFDLHQSKQNFESRFSQSISDPDAFWESEAKKRLHWSKEFSTVTKGSFADGTMEWFPDGKINACYNCIDRHLATKRDQTALIWEGDEPGEGRSYTYGELHEEISKIANVMKSRGVKKGDVVTIYMPMIPQTAMVMLACARIGAVHSVVFAGFSSDALRDRIENCDSKFVFTSDEGKRGSKRVQLKNSVDAAVKGLDHVKNVFVFQHTGANVDMTEGRDLWMQDLLATASKDCPIEEMNSEDTLFILYTSGSTGKPKGVVHTTGGYLLGTTVTTQASFDLRDGDIYCCAADCGWITGHSYIVYGPLSNGGTTIMFESIPTYPDPYRYWDLIQRHKVTQFYTAPTAIRALMRFDAEPIKKYDLSSLRVLGSVGEPINPEAWLWYYENVGRKTCTVVDTYWQTETGAHVATNIPGVGPMKPGSCSGPHLGINFAILDSKSGEEQKGQPAEGVLCISKPWPSMARTVYGDHERYKQIYLQPYPGYYFTGDNCRRDQDGFYFITGRVDDVINPSGHRIGTAELEAAINEASAVSETAVVGFPHAVKGEGICCFVVLKEGEIPSDDLTKNLVGMVRKAIGPIATPDYIVYTDLPKTRSGKIMRRVLRKIASGTESELGDISTLADPAVVPRIVSAFKTATSKK